MIIPGLEAAVAVVAEVEASEVDKEEVVLEEVV